MKNNPNKKVALFLIFLIISISSSYTIKPVVAQQEKSGCCEKTKDGIFCAETSKENCDDNSLFDQNAKCEDVSFCAEDKLTCCFYHESGDCTSRTIRNECIAKGGQPLSGAMCDTAQECKIGCC